MTQNYLLDTSVVSVLAPRRPDVMQGFLSWVGRKDRQLFISTVTIVEIEQGIARLFRSSADRRAAMIQAWLADLLITTGSNTLPMDVAIAHVAGKLSDAAYAIGRHPGLADILIAATARVHGLTLLTRNVRHFEPLGIDVVDPLTELPD